jgi:hypothetical protein
MRDRRPVRGPVWITAYAVCVLLVLPFIAFEVLDVDGSDFANPVRSAMSLKVTEPEQDLRRAAFQTPISQPVVPSLAPGSEQRETPRVVDRVGAETPARITISRDFRSALPRSLLPAPAPSV